MSRRRQTIASRLVEAQHTAAMLTTFNEVDMTAVMELRTARKEAFQERHGVGLGFMSFFTKASIGALKAFPRLNAEIQGDEIVLKHYYDIGIAVERSKKVWSCRSCATPTARASPRSRRTIGELAGKARDGKLALAELLRRHLHDHQRRHLRLAALDADPEHAAGRHPRHARDPAAPGRPQR